MTNWYQLHQDLGNNIELAEGSSTFSSTERKNLYRVLQVLAQATESIEKSVEQVHRMGVEAKERAIRQR